MGPVGRWRDGNKGPRGRPVTNAGLVHREGESRSAAHVVADLGGHVTLAPGGAHPTPPPAPIGYSAASCQLLDPSLHPQCPGGVRTVKCLSPFQSPLAGVPKF